MTPTSDIALVRAVLARAKVSADSRVAEIAVAARKVVNLDDDPAGDLEQEALLDDLFQLVGCVAPLWCAAEILRLMRDTYVTPEQPSPDAATWALVLALLLFALCVVGVTFWVIVRAR